MFIFAGSFQGGTFPASNNVSGMACLYRNVKSLFLSFCYNLNNIVNINFLSFHFNKTKVTSVTEYLKGDMTHDSFTSSSSSDPTWSHPDLQPFASSSLHHQHLGSTASPSLLKYNGSLSTKTHTSHLMCTLFFILSIYSFQFLLIELRQ